MHISGTLKTAARALRANLGRSILTVLGIVIGIVAIVLVVALGEGAQSLILNEVQGIGANAVIVRPGRRPSGPTGIAETILSDSIKDRDIAALAKKQNVPNAASVDPAILVTGPVTYADNLFHAQTFGWTAQAIQELFNVSPEEGQFFTEEDIRQRAKVAILGSRVKDELFGESDAIGQFVKIKGQNMRVIGVFPKKGNLTVFNLDEVVLVPYSTAQKTLLGTNYYHEVFVRADKSENVDIVASDITATLRELHGITDPAKDDFFVTTQQDAVELIGTVTQVLTIFLVAIASISLLVGGIGIMNIMLVSVTERTQEIGLRKALGATNKDISQQFLLEAVILTVSGGIIGTALALSLSGLVAFVARSRFNINWPFSWPLDAIALGVGVAAAIGLLFGIYPARTAAKKNPIEALRYE